MVFRYRSGYLQRDILNNTAVAAHIRRQCPLQQPMMMWTQRRIVVISRYIVLCQIRLELNCGFFVWIMEVLWLHFYRSNGKHMQKNYYFCYKLNTDVRNWFYFQLKIFIQRNFSIPCRQIVPIVLHERTTLYTRIYTMNPIDSEMNSSSIFAYACILHLYYVNLYSSAIHCIQYPIHVCFTFWYKALINVVWFATVSIFFMLVTHELTLYSNIEYWTRVGCEWLLFF